MPTIVISYRREDTRWIVGRIFDRLVDHYGHDSIFMDIDGVPAGVDYRDEIRSNLQRSNIVLAVIGPQWLAVQKETGQPRIADETDWVRIEIEAALEKKITVIPVLIDRARLPKPSELPETMREFAYRQAADVDTGVDFQSHIDRLIRAIDQLLDQQSRATKSNADLKSDQVEQNNDRSPLILLSNTKSGLDKVQRRKVGEFSNSRTPLDLGMIGKVSGWLNQQAIIVFHVIKSPKDFVSSIDLASSSEFGKSVQFLFFVMICYQILLIPLTVLETHVHPFNVTTQLTGLILNAIATVVFGSAIWLFGRALGGKGQYRSTLIATFYSTALFLFIGIITIYVIGDDTLRVASGSGGLDQIKDPVKLAITAVVTLIFIGFLTVKLLPLVKIIHSIGTIKALLVLGLTFAVRALYLNYVGARFADELIKEAITK